MKGTEKQGDRKRKTQTQKETENKKGRDKKIF